MPDLPATTPVFHGGGQPHLIDERDRVFAEEAASAGGMLPPQLPRQGLAGRPSQSPRPPRFAGLGGGGVTTTSFKEIDSPKRRGGGLERGAGGVVTVPEVGGKSKEWGASQTDSREKFKSNALFWEIRLKESKSKLRQAEKEGGTHPMAMQICEACTVLDEYAVRAATNGDTVLRDIKGMIFAGVYADYDSNLGASKGADARARVEVLRASVPYYAIAERQHRDIINLTRKCRSLEMMVERPASAGRKDADAQTDEKDLDGASGLSEMRLRFQQQDEVLRQLESDRFSQRLEIADLVSTSKEQAARLTEQLNRLTKDNTSLKAKVESLLATEESYADLIVKVKEENTNLNQKIQVLSAEHASFKHDADNKTAALSDTLKAERAHFKAERTSWLSSFVTERYDLLNAVEAAARKAGHEHAAPRPADDRVRSDLWGQMVEAEKVARDDLESLYHEESRASVRLPDDAQHIREVKYVLREQEEALEALLVSAPQLNNWVNKEKGKEDDSAGGERGGPSAIAAVAPHATPGPKRKPGK